MFDDVHTFHRFARPYDWVMPGADAAVLAGGLDVARRPVDRVLDLGGGPGRAVRALGATEGLVLDAAGGMVRRAAGHGLAAIQGDAARLPLREAAVDAVVVTDALHHMRGHEAVLAECARVLRPGGALLVREFDPGTRRGWALVATEHLVGFDSTFHRPDDLADMVAAAGLTPVVVERGFAYTVAGLAPGGPGRSESGSPKS